MNNTYLIRSGQKTRTEPNQFKPKTIQTKPNYMSKPFCSRFYQSKCFGLVWFKTKPNRSVLIRLTKYTNNIKI